MVNPLFLCFGLYVHSQAHHLLNRCGSSKDTQCKRPRAHEPLTPTWLHAILAGVICKLGVHDVGLPSCTVGHIHDVGLARSRSLRVLRVEKNSDVSRNNLPRGENRTTPPCDLPSRRHAAIKTRAKKHTADTLNIKYVRHGGDRYSLTLHTYFYSAAAQDNETER